MLVQMKERYLNRLQEPTSVVRIKNICKNEHIIHMY